MKVCLTLPNNKVLTDYQSHYHNHTTYTFDDKYHILVCMKVAEWRAVEACWAHNPEVRGSKPHSANYYFLVTISCQKYNLYFETAFSN